MISFLLGYALCLLFNFCGIPEIPEEVRNPHYRKSIETVYNSARCSAMRNFVISFVFTIVGLALSTGIISWVIGNNPNSIHLDLKIPVLAIVVNSAFALDLIILYLQVNSVRRWMDDELKRRH